MFKSRHFFIIMLVILLAVFNVPGQTQDAESTEDPIPTPVSPTLMPTATPIPPTMAVLTSTPTATLSPTPTLTITQPISATVTASVSSTQTAIPTLTLTPMVEATEELIPISTSAPEATVETTVKVDIPTATVPVSATLTSVSPTQLSVSATTESISPTISSISPTIAISPTLVQVSSTIASTITGTQIMVTITPTIQPTATIGGIGLRYIQGIAHYQNHVTDNGGILVQVYDNGLILISETTTNKDGIYSIAVPLEDTFWLVFSTDSHLTERVFVTDTGSLADIILKAGDLNADACINFDDINLIRVQIDTTNTDYDLNADEQTDLVDVAMLAGNLDPDCQLSVVPTPLATVSATVTVEPTILPIITPTPLMAVSATDIATSTVIAETTEEP